MKYFEVQDPYYALIKANDKELAMKIYTEYVADDEGELNNEMQEIGAYDAFLKFGEGLTDGKEEMLFSEIINNFSSNENTVLLIDGSLL